MELHQLLFVTEMGNGVLSQRLEYVSQHFPPFSDFHGVVQLVDHADELLVLIVKFPDCHAEFVIPVK
jgi:hypothetical protein